MKNIPSKSCKRQSVKVIRPYLSSSFIDVQDEISYLHDNAFKRLDKLCQNYGGYFQPVDNRRTSVDFRSTHDFVLARSLDKIRECQPFFMCVIGNHYGPYCRKEELLTTTTTDIDMTEFQASSAIKQTFITAAAHGHNWIVDEPYALASILELEIQYAALQKGSNTARNHCYFYVHDRHKILLTERPVSSKRSGFAKSHSIQPVREVEDDEAQQKLSSLKDRLISEGYNVRFFNDSESLDGVVYDDWKRVVSLVFDDKKLPDCLKDEPIFHYDTLIEEINNQHLSSFYLYPGLEKLEFQIFGSLESFSKSYIGKTKNDRIITAGNKSMLGGNKLGDGVFSSTKSILKEMLRKDEFMKDKDVGNCEGNDDRIFSLVGDAGVGKSSALYHWVKSFKHQYPGITVIYETGGGFNNNLSDILLRIIRELRLRYWHKRNPNFELCDGSESFERICEIFASTIELIPCIIVIDGLDEINSESGDHVKAVKELHWVPDVIPLTCRFIFSTRRSDLTFKSLLNRCDVKVFSFPKADELGRQEILQRYALSGVHAYFNDRNVSKICRHHLSESPLVISCIVSLMTICRNQRSADSIVDKMTIHRNARELWKGLFTILSKRLSWSRQSSGQPGSLKNRPNIKGWVSDALKLIITSRRGLRREELLQMLTLLGYRGRSTVTPNDWEIFMSACKPALQVTHSGYIYIAHRSVRESLGYWLLGLGVYSNRSEQRRQRYHSFIASYLQNFASVERQLEELLWHLMKASNWPELCQILFNPNYFLHICERSTSDVLFLREILLYWKILEKNDFDVVQCLKHMLSSSQEHSVSNSQEHEMIEKEVSATNVVSVSNTILSTSMNRFDESASVIRDYQTEDSKSDVDYSDTDSSLHNFSEYNSENIETFYVGGWTAIPPEQESQDERTIDDNEVIKLNFYAAWFLHKSGKKFLVQTKELLADCRTWITENWPLSPHQCLVKLFITELECRLAVPTKREVLEDVAESCGSGLLTLLDLSYTDRINAVMARETVLLSLADLLLQNNNFSQAQKLLSLCYDDFENCGSIDGMARVTCVLGQLASKQGNPVSAEYFLKKSLKTFVEWHGRLHVKVAFVLTALGDHYCRFIYSSKENSRRALISYKDALDIYEFNEDMLTSTKILAVMGKLLHMEGTFNSKEEALKCFGKAKDFINIDTDYSILQRIPTLNKDFKKTAADLMVGRYEYGRTPEADSRNEERPFSVFSYHPEELKRLISCTPRIPRNLLIPTTEETPQALKPAPIKMPHYSPYCFQKVGKRMVISSKRSQQIEKLKRPKTTQHPPSMQERNVATGSFVQKRPTTAITRRWDPNRMTSLLLHNDQTSHISFTENVDDWGKSTTEHIASEFITKTSTLDERPIATRGNQRTGVLNTPSNFDRFSRPHSRTVLHRQHCDSPDNPSRTLRQFHGPHSSLDCVFKDPIMPRPRSNVKATGIVHKSAWFHVPGRYVKSGELYAPKRNQQPKTWRSASSPQTDITIRTIYDSSTMELTHSNNIWSRSETTTNE